MTTGRRTIDSPLGRLVVVADHLVREVGFVDGAELPDGGATEVLEQAVTELGEYFAGARTRFTVPLGPRGTTFQERVWQVLVEVPFGETWSYQAVAARLGDPRAVRAVGAANGKNPVAILVPCHRVIGKDGSLVGYGGGLARKTWLLGHERPGLFGR